MTIILKSYKLVMALLIKHGEYETHKMILYYKELMTQFLKILTLYNNLCILADFLSHKYPDYLFIAPLKTKNMEEMVFLPEGYFRLFPFVKTSHTIHAAQMPGQAYEAAKQLGNSHTCFLTFLSKNWPSHYPIFTTCLYDMNNL